MLRPPVSGSVRYHEHENLLRRQVLRARQSVRTGRRSEAVGFPRLAFSHGEIYRRPAVSSSKREGQVWTLASILNFTGSQTSRTARLLRAELPPAALPAHLSLAFSFSMIFSIWKTALVKWARG